MKKIVTFPFMRTAAMLGMAVVMCCSAALLSSCKEDDETTGGDDNGGGTTTPALTVSPANLGFIADGGSATFTVTTNVAWTSSVAYASTDTPQFVTLTPSSGATTTVVTVTVPANEEQAERTATITLTGEGVTAKTITVVQNGAAAPPPPTLTLDPATFTGVYKSATGNGAYYDINVITDDNIEWVAECADIFESGFFPAIFTPDRTVYGGSYTSTGPGIFVVYLSNHSGFTRSSTVTVKSTDGLLSATLSFTQDPFPKTSISPLELKDAPKGGATAKILVNSTIPWSTTTTGGLVSVSPSSGDGSAEPAVITATISNNAGTTDRSGTIKLTAGEFEFTIPVTQRATDPTTVDAIEIGNLKWAKYNQGFAGAIPSTVTYGGIFTADQIANTLCPTGWRLPTVDEWTTGNSSTRETINGVNGLYMNGKDASPSLTTHAFIPFINYVTEGTVSTYQDTGFSGNPDGDKKVHTQYATSDAAADLQKGIRINPFDAGTENKLWFGWSYGDGVPMGPIYGYHVRCVQD
jgi:uncharacterized protein (TIGR02145 family)